MKKLPSLAEAGTKLIGIVKNAGIAGAGLLAAADVLPQVRGVVNAPLDEAAWQALAKQATYVSTGFNADTNQISTDRLKKTYLPFVAGGIIREVLDYVV